MIFYIWVLLLSRTSVGRTSRRAGALCKTQRASELWPGAGVQVPVGNVTTLFYARRYREWGALLWPDFWGATWAPDAPAILNVLNENMPTISHESGQMLFNKAKYGSPLSRIRQRVKCCRCLLVEEGICFPWSYSMWAISSKVYDLYSVRYTS